jgi:MFS transporter, YNFM family, putative membrane transport protein
LSFSFRRAMRHHRGANISENGFPPARSCRKKPAPRVVSTLAMVSVFLPSTSNVSVASPSSAPRQTPVRSIILLAAAGFASQAQVRVTDSLLPQIATDFRTTVGVAAIVLTAYAITHGSIQFVVGPVADRFGKYRTVAIASVLAAALVAVCGTVSTLPQLAIARLATGAVAGWVIPVSMAYVGDVTPADRLQPILARYASGYILGQLFGQAAGGVLGDLFGWRNVFFALGGMFALAAAGLIFELVANPQTHAADHRAATRRGFVADYAAILSNPFARMIIMVGFIEGALAWGAFAYIGANLHLRFDLSFTLVGLTVACFGIGGLIYSGLVRLLVYRLGQIGLTIIGGFVITAAYVVLAFQPVWWFAPLAVTAIGLGFYMFHNTLQTKATQMTPEARGTAVAIFSSALYFGQTAGVAAGALVIDRLGAKPLFLGTAVAFPMLAIWFARELRRRDADQTPLR